MQGGDHLHLSGELQKSSVGRLDVPAAILGEGAVVRGSHMGLQTGG